MSLSLNKCKKLMAGGKKFNLGLLGRMKRTVASLQRKLDEWEEVLAYAEQHLDIPVEDTGLEVKGE